MLKSSAATVYTVKAVISCVLVKLSDVYCEFILKITEKYKLC